MAIYKNVSVGAHVHGGKVYAPGAVFEADATTNIDKLVKIGVLAKATKADKASAATAATAETTSTDSTDSTEGA